MHKRTSLHSTIKINRRHLGLAAFVLKKKILALSVFSEIIKWKLVFTSELNSYSRETTAAESNRVLCGDVMFAKKSERAPGILK